MCFLGKILHTRRARDAKCLDLAETLQSSGARARFSMKFLLFQMSQKQTTFFLLICPFGEPDLGQSDFYEGLEGVPQ